jgi:hypothetical protein
MDASGQDRAGRTAGRRTPRKNNALTVVAVVLLVMAVRQELRLPREERTWHGTVPVQVPYDLRPPTLQRLRHRLWDPTEPRLVVPTVFGLGWTVNVARLLRRQGS